MANNYGGIAQGLATGVGLAQGFQDRQDRKAQQDREYGLQLNDQTQRFNRQNVEDARADADYGVKVAEDEHKAAVTDVASALTKYKSFDAMPPELQAKFTDQAKTIDETRNAARTKRNQLVFGKPKDQQSYSDIISNLQTGRAKLEDVPPDKLYLAVANATQRDPADFMSAPDGGPSPISKAVGDVTTGMQTGNNGMMLSGANVLLAPELRKGVGTESPHGGKIVFKEIDRLIPDPNDPSKITPVLKVYVDQGKDFRGPRGAHRETGYYYAPLTEGRTSDPNDPVKFLDMRTAMDHVGQLGMITEVMNQPGFRARMEEGRRTAGSQTQSLVDSLMAEGAVAMPKKQLTTTPIKLGDSTLLRTTDPQGQEVSRETVAHTLKPARERTFAMKNDEIDQMVEDGDISEDDARRLKIKNLSGIDPARSVNGNGRGGGRVPAAIRVTENEVKGTLKDVERNIAAAVGIQLNPASKRWVTADGKPASPELIKTYNEAYNRAAVKIRDNQASGKKTGLSSALEAASSQGAAPAPVTSDQFKTGQIYTNPKGQKGKYLGSGKWEEVK